MRGSSALLVFLFILPAVSAQTDISTPIEEGFTKPLKNVNRVFSFDLDKKNGPEIYAVTYLENRAMLYVFDWEGNPSFVTTISREGSQEAGKETVQNALVTDLDDNKFLDIITATEIQASGIMNHRVYRMQRIPEEGLERLYNRFVWMAKDTGRVTGLEIADVNADGLNEMITSSTDDTVKVYDLDGPELLRLTLTSSLWDVTPMPPEKSSSNKTSEVSNKTLGQISGSAYLAAGSKNLYLILGDGTIIWQRPCESRFQASKSFDVNGDGRPEYLGLCADNLRVYDYKGQQLWEYNATKSVAIDSVQFPGVSGRYTVLAAGKSLVFLGRFGKEVFVQNVSETILSARTFEYKGESKILVGSMESLSSFDINNGYFRANDAESSLDEALRSYNAENFTWAANRSREAALIYEELGLYGNQSSALTLAQNSETLIEADGLYEKASSEYMAKNFNQSREYALSAKDLYKQVGYLKGVNKSRELESLGKDKTSKIVDNVVDRSRGDEYYTKAEAYYIQSEYSESTRYAQMALAEYQKIGYGDGERTAEKLVQMNMNAMARTTTTTSTTTTTIPKSAGYTVEDIVSYLVVAVGIVILVYALATRLRRK